MKIYSSVLSVLEPINLFNSQNTGKISVSSNITGVSGSQVDAHFWLPMCASTYNISKKLSDYVCVPVVGFFTDIPNTNGDSISKQEALAWDSDSGCPAYKTFKGKPTHVEHANGDLKAAKGVIFDSYISPLSGFNGQHAKVVMLAAFDRSKDRVLVDSILSGQHNKYSIGAKFDAYTCSITGNTYADAKGSQFTRPGVPTYTNMYNQLVYRSLHNIRGFELSVVATPAFCTAVSDTILNK